MNLTQEETTALILASRRDKVLHMNFGPGWCALIDVPGNEWAFECVKQMRAEAAKGAR